MSSLLVFKGFPRGFNSIFDNIFRAITIEQNFYISIESS